MAYKLQFFNYSLFEENIIYESTDNNSQIILDENIIEFKKNVKDKCDYAWVGYNFSKPGFYNLTFEILSNKDIINFDFIKLHSPFVKFYKTPTILANIWTSVDIIIEVVEPDLFCFIFDEFIDEIKILYKNVNFVDVIEQNGIVINEIDSNKTYKSQKCILNKKNEIYKFDKEETVENTPFTWFGYNIKPAKVKTIMSFDIMFLSDVPTQDDKLFIKTHDPEE
jgi:hypothetical protein